MAEQGKGFAGLLGNVFGTAPPAYMEGLLGQQATEDLRKRSIGTGIANALLGYAAMPKNKNLGLGTILAGAAQAGIGGARGVYDNARNDYVQGQAIAEAKRKQEQQQALQGMIGGIADPNEKLFAQIAPEQYVASKVKPAESPFAKLNPSDYTKESIAEYVKNGNDVTKLVSKEKDKNLTQDRNAIAYANFGGKSFAELTPDEAKQVNKYLENEKVRVAGAGVPSRAPTFVDATPIRKEYNDNPIVKAFDKQESAFKIIEATMTRPSPAGDLAGTTKFMKLLDPESVVRESEFGLARNATGLYDKMKNYSDQLTKGTILNPAQRKDFLNTAREFYDIATEAKLKVQNQYADIAKVGGLDPRLIIGIQTEKQLPAGVTVRVRGN